MTFPTKKCLNNFKSIQNLLHGSLIQAMGRNIKLSTMERQLKSHTSKEKTTLLKSREKELMRQFCRLAG